MNKKQEYYKNFEKKLEQTLLDICTSNGLLNGQILLVDELDEKWDEIAPYYMEDAIPEVRDYPTVAVAWAGYVGMGVASLWDTVWDEYSTNKNIYSTFASPRGFDCMDEYILEEILNLKLESKEAIELENLMRSLATSTTGMIRREGISPQSPEAFYIFTHSVKVLFRIGVSVILSKLGYKYEKAIVSTTAPVS